MMYREGRKFAGACPRCQEPLQDDARMAGVKACPTCGGVFAGIDASRRIVATLDRTLLAIGFEARLGKREPNIERGRAISCPECLIEMQRVPVESAVCEIDACSTHGTWFDPGELEAVMRAYASARRKGVMPPSADARPSGPKLDLPDVELVDPGDTGRSPWKKAWDALLASLDAPKRKRVDF